MAGTTFEIHDSQFTSLKDAVVVITGCASGIGLATTLLLLEHGAFIVAGDLSPPPSLTHDSFVFQRCDVTSWSDLTALFATAQKSSPTGRIDHVFANAGISGGSEFYIDLKTDPATGLLLEPSHFVFDVNLRGVINTASLAFYYMRSSSQGGSVVMTASASAFQRFGCVDYASAKHGVLGFMRGMLPVLARTQLSTTIRVNIVGPSWTITGLVPAGVTERFGKPSQSPDVVARAVAVLMADRTRNGQFVYTVAGVHREVEESVLLKAAEDIMGDGPGDDVVFEGILGMASAAAAAAAGVPKGAAKEAENDVKT